MFLHRPTYQWWLCLRSYLLSKNVSIENWRRLQVKSVEMCGRTMCALCQQSHSLSAQVTESSSRVSGFHCPQIHKVGAGNGGKRREGVWGFNQGWSESLFEDSMGSSQWLGANSNPQVFRLNLLNFLNAAPFHAPMLQLAIIYKVSDGSPLPPKTNSVPSFSPALSFFGPVTFQGIYSGYSFFDLANLSIHESKIRMIFQARGKGGALGAVKTIKAVKVWR